MKFRLDITVTHWPLKEPFYITGHRFDRSSTLETTLHNGTQSGKGEASGVYYRGETAEQLSRAVEAMRSTVENGITRDELQHLMAPGGARNALDCALWDLEAAETGRPVWSLAGLTRIRPLMTTWTIGAATPEKMAATARQYQGTRAIKLKLLGDGVDADRVRAVRQERPEVWLGVDANQGYVPDTLDKLVPALLTQHVSLLEQPCKRGHEDDLEFVGQARMEHRLVPGTIRFDVAELNRFPSVLFVVERRVERVTVDVRVRIALAFNGSCFTVQKCRVHHISRSPVFVVPISTLLVLAAKPSLHVGLHSGHGFRRGLAQHPFHVLIVCYRQV